MFDKWDHILAFDAQIYENSLISEPQRPGARPDFHQRPSLRRLGWWRFLYPPGGDPPSPPLELARDFVDFTEIVHCSSQKLIPPVNQHPELRDCRDPSNSGLWPLNVDDPLMNVLINC